MKWLLVAVAIYTSPGEEPRVMGLSIQDTTKEVCEAGEYFRAYDMNGISVAEIASCIEQGEA